MALKRTKLLGITSVTGIHTVGIFTVGVTDCTGPVGVASTTYVRGIIQHNTGLNTCVSTVYVYPGEHTPTAVGDTSYRLSRVALAANETYYFETNYPIVLVDRETIVVEVTASSNAGTGIGSQVNYQLLGDTDVND